MGRQLKMIIYAGCKESTADELMVFGKIANTAFSRFFACQFREGLILGSMFAVSMAIFGMPYPLTVGVLMAFTALIPVFGAFIGTAIASILIVVVSPVKALWFIIFIIILQQIEGNIIYPKVVGSSVGLPAMWVMLAVIVGGSCFGMVGMLIGVPVSSVLYTLFRESVNEKLKEKNIEI